MLSKLPSALFLLLSILCVFSATATSEDGENVCTSEDCVLSAINIGYIVGSIPCDPADTNCVETCTPTPCDEAQSLGPFTETSSTPSKSGTLVDCNTSPNIDCTTQMFCELKLPNEPPNGLRIRYGASFKNIDVEVEEGGVEVKYLTEGAEWSFRGKVALSRPTRAVSNVKSRILKLNYGEFPFPITGLTNCQARVECLKGPKECFIWQQDVGIDTSCQSPIVSGTKIGAFQILDPVTNCSSSSSGSGSTGSRGGRSIGVFARGSEVRGLMQ